MAVSQCTLLADSFAYNRLHLIFARIIRGILDITFSCNVVTISLQPLSQMQKEREKKRKRKEKRKERKNEQSVFQSGFSNERRRVVTFRLSVYEVFLVETQVKLVNVLSNDTLAVRKYETNLAMTIKSFLGDFYVYKYL